MDPHANRLAPTSYCLCFSLLLFTVDNLLDPLARDQLNGWGNVNPIHLSSEVGWRLIARYNRCQQIVFSGYNHLFSDGVKVEQATE